MNKLTFEEWDALPLEERFTKQEIDEMMKEAEHGDIPIIPAKKSMSLEKDLKFWLNYKTIKQ